MADVEEVVEPTRRTTFLCAIAQTQSAIKISGKGEGGLVTFDVPEIMMPQFLPLTTMREVPLRVTVEVAEDYENNLDE